MRPLGWHARSVAFLLAVLCAVTTPAYALTIELTDVAPDRVERQRAAAAGMLPLPGTPNVSMLQDRLRDKGISINAPALIRIFKAESDLEVWKEKNGVYVLFATYPICHWSGSLGPKLRTGDKQAPEGFYTVDRARSRHVGRWPRSLDLGFPNVFDISQARTGSDILVHGGCSSIGCFAMTNPVMDEIHLLTTAAVDNGQFEVPVHVFPFRMTDENMKTHANSPWTPYWSNLKQGHDAFDRTHRPPAVSVCNGQYLFRDTLAGEQSGPVTACDTTLLAIKDQDSWLDTVPLPSALAPRVQPVPGSSEVQTTMDRDTTPAPRFSWPLVR